MFIFNFYVFNRAVAIPSGPGNQKQSLPPPFPSLTTGLLFQNVNGIQSLTYTKTSETDKQAVIDWLVSMCETQTIDPIFGLIPSGAMLISPKIRATLNYLFLKNVTKPTCVTDADAAKQDIIFIISVLITQFGYASFYGGIITIYLLALLIENNPKIALITFSPTNNNGNSNNTSSAGSTISSQNTQKIFSLSAQILRQSQRIVNKKTFADTFVDNLNSDNTRSMQTMLKNKSNIIIISSIVLFLNALSLILLTANIPIEFIQKHQFTLIFSCLSIGLILNLLVGFLCIYANSESFFYPGSSVVVLILFASFSYILFFIFYTGDNIMKFYENQLHKSQSIESNEYILWIAAAISSYGAIFYLVAVNHFLTNIMLTLSLGIIGPFIVFVLKLIYDLAIKPNKNNIIGYK